MSHYSLDKFVRETRAVISGNYEPSVNVEKIVPLMFKLLSGDKSFLKPEHFQNHPDHYARNAIFVDDAGLMSLYALVWQPGQWTPIHDHGTWGVVGVHEGVLEECSFVRSGSQSGAELDNIDLLRGGVILLPPDSVTSFVPNPDHIHLTGNPSLDKRVVSLHLYGNAMAGFHVYDQTSRSRKWVEVSHNES
ncbi:MAG: putative metal-dependent enzyme (double-stranded beta helix superfamily) [Parasphingorhabdus sp.]|jgi:predicted metal-dependent enzyme (double-stranded beta helix superfamily)